MIAGHSWWLDVQQRSLIVLVAALSVLTLACSGGTDRSESDMSLFESLASVSASLSAYSQTHEPAWLQEAEGRCTTAREMRGIEAAQRDAIGEVCRRIDEGDAQGASQALASLRDDVFFPAGEPVADDDAGFIADEPSCVNDDHEPIDGTDTDAYACGEPEPNPTP